MSRRAHGLLGWVGLALWVAACPGAEQVPILGQAPAMSLVDQSGQAFDAQRLKGKVWIASFMFTSCPDVCPMLTSKMRSLQLRFGKHKRDVELISISVDPETDTPAKLTEFAKEHGADLSNWSFLTGEPAVVRSVVMEGFKQAMQDVPPTDNAPRNILHGTHVVLVDRRGQIRGFYRTENTDLLQLTRDAQPLLKEKP